MQNLEHSEIRACFPFLKEGYAYFDNAAMSPKPIKVIERMVDYYQNYPANVHRSTHSLSSKATYEYEKARDIVKKFINANSVKEIVVVRSTTEAINLIAKAWGEKFLTQEDTILISQLEHHSNVLPWREICARKNCRLEVVPITLEGDINLESYRESLKKGVKLVSITYVSNTLGTKTPLQKIIEMAHKAGALVFVDAAQAVAHLPLDVQFLNCDFLCFSGYKLYGPTGVGILYGKQELLENIPPYLLGGGMIYHVASNKYAPLPFKFEAGTPPVAELIGLGAAIEFITSIGLENIWKHENTLFDSLITQLNEIPGIVRLGNPIEQIGLCSIISKNIHPHDLGTLLDKHKILTKAGHHCTQPLMEFYKIPASLRISLGLHNNFNDIDRLIYTLNQIRKMF